MDRRRRRLAAQIVARREDKKRIRALRSARVMEERAAKKASTHTYIELNNLLTRQLRVIEGGVSGAGTGVAGNNNNNIARFCRKLLKGLVPRGGRRT